MLNSSYLLLKDLFNFANYPIPPPFCTVPMLRFYNYINRKGIWDEAKDKEWKDDSRKQVTKNRLIDWLIDWLVDWLYNWFVYRVNIWSPSQEHHGVVWNPWRGGLLDPQISKAWKLINKKWKTKETFLSMISWDSKTN